LLDSGEDDDSAGTRGHDIDKDRGNEFSAFTEAADWDAAPDDKAGVAPVK
jgi:hypothetical protein